MMVLVNIDSKSEHVWGQIEDIIEYINYNRCLVSIYHAEKYGKSTFNGLVFVEEQDAIAFKLKFGI